VITLHFQRTNAARTAIVLADAVAFDTHKAVLTDPTSGKVLAYLYRNANDMYFRLPHSTQWYDSIQIKPEVI